jgi:hypothetical protein
MEKKPVVSFGILVTSMCILLLVLPASAQLADTLWPMFHHDLNHTRRSPYLGAPTGVEKWNFTSGGEILSSPAIGSDGTIYVPPNFEQIPIALLLESILSPFFFLD